MTAVSYEGDVVEITLDLTVRRNFVLETTLHGYMIFDGHEYISIWDTRSSRNVHMERGTRRGMFTPEFVPICLVDVIGLEFVSVQATDRIFVSHNITRFITRIDAVMLGVMSERYGSQYEALMFFAPGETIADITDVKQVLRWYPRWYPLLDSRHDAN